MAAIILNQQAIAEGDSYVPADGINRVVVAIGFGEANYGVTIDSMSLGDTPMETLVTHSTYGQMGKGGIYIIREPNIPAAGGVLTPSWSGSTVAGFRGTIYTLGHVRQESSTTFLDLLVQDGVDNIDFPITTAKDGVMLTLACSSVTARDFSESTTVDNSTIPFAVAPAGDPGSAFDLFSLYDEVTEAGSGILHFKVGNGTTTFTIAGAVFASDDLVPPTISETFVADDQDSALADRTVLCSVHNPTTKAVVRAPTEVVITNGAFSLSDGTLAYDTNYFLYTESADGTYGRGFYSRTQVDPTL